MGQFSWIDSMLEDSFLVEAFFELLIEGRVPSDWRPPSNAIHLREIEKMSSYRERFEADLDRPILQYPNDYF